MNLADLTARELAQMLDSMDPAEKRAIAGRLRERAAATLLTGDRQTLVALSQMLDRLADRQPKER
jgi:hypothetical protein